MRVTAAVRFFRFMATDPINFTEAAALTGQHREKIRRFVNKIKDNKEDPRRSQIKPSYDDYKAFKKKGTSFEWEIERQLIVDEFGISEGFEHEPIAEAAERRAGESALLRERKERIEFLEAQCGAKDGQLEGLNERLREAHILQKNATDELTQIPANVRRAVQQGKDSWLHKHRYISNLWKRKQQPQAVATDVVNASSDEAKGEGSK